MPEGGNVTPGPCVFPGAGGPLSAMRSRSDPMAAAFLEPGTSLLIISSMKRRPGKTAILLGIVLCAAAWSCGEEHRDEEASGEGSADLFRFSLETGREAPPIIFSQVIDGRKVFIEVRGDDINRFTGTFEPGSGRIVLDEGIVLNITAADFWGDAPGAFTFRARDRIEIARGFPAIRNVFPTFGAFIVVDGVDTVTAIFVDSPGERGVDLRVNGSQSTFFREAAFAGLFGVDEDVRRQKASLAFIIMDLLVEQIFFTAQTVATIREHEQTLADEGVMVFSCDDFSLLNGPGQIPAQGSRTLTFFDADGDAEVGSGDGFRWDFVSCWEGERISLVEGMADGRVDFADLVESVERRNGRDVTTRFGFSRGNGTGVQYTDFVHTQVLDDNEAFALDVRRVFTINGGFDLVFSEAGPDEP